MQLGMANLQQVKIMPCIGTLAGDALTIGELTLYCSLVKSIII